MEKSNIDLSVIILSYKSKEHLKVLLPSVLASTKKYSFEIIVVDNGSGDGTAEFIQELIDKLRISNYESDRPGLPADQACLPADQACLPADQACLPAGRRNPQLTLIKNTNTGFAAGNNLGIKQAKGQYVLLLNPDTKVEPDTFEIMLDFMESRPEVGISGCKVVKPDGKLDLACRRKFPNPWNSFLRLARISNRDYNLTDADPNSEMEIDSVMGAFLLIRKSVIEKIGLLDEQFFMYGEDLDWCWRCQKSGFKVWYYPKTSIVHYKGASSRKEPFRMLKAFHDAMWIFYRKHYSGRYFFVFNWLVWFGIYGRLFVLIFVNLFKKNRVVSK